MTNRQDILELAARCEAAAGPDRELDCRIWALALGETSFENCRAVVPDLNDWQTPNVTASLDAAMTLVPEGWNVGTFCLDWQSGKWRCAIVQLPNDGQRRAFLEGKTFGVEAEIAEAATGPLALTAAALKARAHTKGEE